MTSPVEPAMESNVVPPPFAFGAQGPPSQEAAAAVVQSGTAKIVLPADAKSENLEEYKANVAKEMDAMKKCLQEALAQLRQQGVNTDFLERMANPQVEKFGVSGWP